MGRQAGNIFFFLFGAVAVAGVLGAAIQNYVMGPLKTATMVNKRNAAHTELQLSLRVMAIAAAGDQANNGDCDADGSVEPLPYADAGVNPHPTGGGILPSTIGGSKRDPWGSDYGYCVWDHGSAVDDVGCGGPAQLRLPGTNGDQWEVIAIISAGPDRTFQTSCNAWADLDVNSEPDTPLVDKPAGSDDMYYAWTYAEAANGTGGNLWTLEDLDPDTAEINKNLSVKDGSNVEQLAFDTTAKTLTVGTGGAGVFPTVRADYLSLLTTGNASIQVLDAISLPPEDGSGTTFYIRNPTGDTLQITPSANGAIPGLHLTPEGYVGIGTTPGSTSGLSITGDHRDININNSSTASSGHSGDVNFYRSRSGATVQNGDRLGGIRFYGYGPTAGLHSGVEMNVLVDGAPGVGDMPARFEISVAADGSVVDATPEFVIKNTGYIGIGGVTNPTVTLDVGGDIHYTGTITDVSDRRLKDNIRPLEGSLDKLMMLDGFAFEMKGDKKKQTEYGVMAQDVQKVFPELVREVDDKGHLGVTYDGLIPPIIEAIKELEAENKKLRAEIELLKRTKSEKE